MDQPTTAGGSAGGDGALAGLARLVRAARRRINYFAEYWILGLILLAALFGVWRLFANLPPRPEVQDWEQAPQKVWTAVESDELARQLATNQLQVSAELYGPGPVPLDRSHSRTLPSPQRQRFNELTEDLKQAYSSRLQGDPFGEQSLQSLRDNLIALPGRTRPDRQGAQDIAYQLAIVDFLERRFLDARKGLAAAGCDQSLAADDATEDSNANRRSQTIRCNWLGGRLDLASDQRDAGLRRQGVAKLRTALQAAIAASPPDAAIAGGVAVGPAGRSRFGQIPSLLSGDYWMTLPEAAGAGLWQDYLASLLATRTALCTGPCNGWSTARLTDDGQQFAKIAAQPNQPELWRAYPELAALTRMLLVVNGMIAEARKVGPEADGLNLADADSSQDGFQLSRGSSRADMVTLHPGYLEFARLAMIVSRPDPLEPAPHNGEPSAASRFWLQHNVARSNWLRQGSPAVENVFRPGTNEAKAFDSFQSGWSAVLPGVVSIWWYVALLVLVILPLLVLGLAVRAGFAIGQSRARHSAELFGSKYFASAQARVNARGGAAGA
ncbi:MAG TPA: hypothetical protein VFQ67_01900 [Allosphingosinicella sp.]|nr:hypothetical protein [Allosphingosinicella sp.]